MAQKEDPLEEEKRKTAECVENIHKSLLPCTNRFEVISRLEDWLGIKRRETAEEKLHREAAEMTGILDDEYEQINGNEPDKQKNVSISEI